MPPDDHSPSRRPDLGTHRRFPRLAAAALTALVILSANAGAEESAPYPLRPVRLVAAQEPGSATDKVARVLAEALASVWRQPVVVENRPGAAGTIGAEHVARALPDGYTFLVGGLSNLAVSPALRPEVRYDSLRDFAPLGRVAQVPFAFAVNAGVPAHTLAEFVATARAHPGKFSYGSLGGGVTGLCMALLIEATGIDMLPVEYKGASSAINDLVAGRVDFLCNEIGALSAQAQAGRVRLLALPGPQRVAIVPDVPTTAETGLPAVRVAPWYGLLVPAGTPQPILDRIASALDAAARSEAFRHRIVAMGYLPIHETPAQFARALRADVDTARRLLGRARAAEAVR